LVAKNPLLGIGMLSVLFTVVITAIAPTNLVWGATILCPVAPTSFCQGTEESDNIIGAAGGNGIDGLGGNDVITAKGSADVVHGRDGNDQISGGGGPDSLTGDGGADLISGGDGNDRIFHFVASNNPDAQTQPDGSRDRIDCGPGNDETWINVSVDHDLAVNCETVNAG
jgi:Ca2+-binding RTX toxin-like protein